MTFERNETKNHGGKIIFETAYFLLTSPFRTVATSRSPISPTSSGVTKCGHLSSTP